MSNQHLIVITGPVGGGKSTTSVALAACLRSRGLRPAVVDLDDVYCMADPGGNDFAEEDTWSAARRACGALAESFFASGLDAVVVDGKLFSAEEWNELQTCVPPQADVRFFTLVVSFEETFRRAQGDPDRQNTTEVWYKRMHDKFISSLDFLRETSGCIEADELPAEKIAAWIADRLLTVPKKGSGMV